MTRVVKKDTTLYYACEECGYLYEEEKWAAKCEAWCNEHESCNLEILKHGAPGENLE